MLKFEDKNNDGLIQYTGGKAVNEMVKVDRNIIVLANPEIAGFPNWMIAIVAVGGLAESSIFPALMMGIFSKKMNKEGAIAGMLSGIGITLFYVFQHKGIMFVQSTSFLGDMDSNLFLGIEPNAFGVIGAAVNFAVAFLVMSRTAPVPKEVEEMIENIRVPSHN